ncbi:TMEM175 family protein [Candidatus Enterococcus leclercqii]|uniref:TMEM175 family protein n=1 Tax=Candidatus Enterococcus leclercqii TaxID=1857218 RepID=UPI0023511DA9|nr:TMEM175 family protein [Enterococcus sp. CU9D]
MTKNRLEVFTDGVMAIVITILVLDIKLPEMLSFSMSYEIRHTFIAYTVSFIFISVIWVSHHRLFQLVDKIDYTVILANIFFAFLVNFVPISN